HSSDTNFVNSDAISLENIQLAIALHSMIPVFKNLSVSNVFKIPNTSSDVPLFFIESINLSAASEPGSEPEIICYIN
ncbi:hypothetical protein ALC57_01622, partial [Trachymyrmex cornetzi]